MKIGDFLYRYEDHRFALPVDENENPTGLYTDKKYGVQIRLIRMRVTRINPRSVTINYYGEPKRIYTLAKNPWAYPSKEEAFKAYKRRKRNHFALLSEQLNEIKGILNKINGGQYNEIKDIEEVEV